MALFCCCTTVRDLFVEIAFCFSFCVDPSLWLALQCCIHAQSIGLSKRTSIMGTNPYVGSEHSSHSLGRKPGSRVRKGKGWAVTCLLRHYLQYPWYGCENSVIQRRESHHFRFRGVRFM